LALDRAEVAAREWSDGAPTYYLRIVTQSGETFATGSSWSREEVDSVQQRVEAFMRRARGGCS
jgi:hypothetical protein